MNRRIGISILGVVSLTTGVLVAEYAFAPLREPYPITDQAQPQPAAESTASPSEAAPTGPTNQTQHTPPPVERRQVEGEPEGDPMMAAVQPVIEAVWQNVAMPAAGNVRVTWASTAELAGQASAARATPVFGVASIGLGGAFLGTQRAGAAKVQSATLTPPTAVTGAATGDTPDSTSSETTPPSMGMVPEETLAMNDPPSAPMPDVLDDSMEPLPSWLPSMEPAAGSEEPTPAEPQPESLPPAEPVASLPEDFVSEPLPQVTVPEPLPTSLFLFGVLLGVLSRRRRLAA